MFGQFGVPVVLLDGDDRDIRFLEHDASPVTAERSSLPTAPAAVTALCRDADVVCLCRNCRKRRK
jgi:hypothetical protein